jgi:thiosulfate/3-mercaptopyruvate sulfurtransferase
MPNRVPIVVDTTWLRSHPDVIVVDVRWTLGIGPQPDKFALGHIPGARFVDLERYLSRHDLAPTAGRHPLPTPEAFAISLGELGISASSTVVAYDDAGGSIASRMVWMLRSIGQSAALLNGGLAAWDGPLETGPGADIPAVSADPRAWPTSMLVTHDDVADATRASGSSVLDARSADRYRGEAGSVDNRPGHIPGAISAPWSGNIDPATGLLLSADALRRRFADLGVATGDRVVVSCGSGVTACANAIALTVAGYDNIELFVPSWSGWSADSTRKAATGPEPGRQ